jgi:hypothetical protein
VASGKTPKRCWSCPIRTGCPGSRNAIAKPALFAGPKTQRRSRAPPQRGRSKGDARKASSATPSQLLAASGRAGLNAGSPPEAVHGARQLHRPNLPPGRPPELPHAAGRVPPAVSMPYVRSCRPACGREERPVNTDSGRARSRPARPGAVAQPLMCRVHASRSFGSRMVRSGRVNSGRAATDP